MYTDTHSHRQYSVDLSFRGAVERGAGACGGADCGDTDAARVAGAVVFVAAGVAGRVAGGPAATDSCIYSLATRGTIVAIYHNL